MSERESNAVDSGAQGVPGIGFSEQQRSSARDESEKQTPNFLPTVSLPRGGGAIRGIGEKFTANPVTGTGSLSVPIATSPGRSGFGPQLSLSYDSGAGNGPFGCGWNLSIPSITRKTDKGLPRYKDAEESDVFILSGSEDLVPILVNDGEQWQRETLPPREVDGKEYKIQRYRPRIEGLFALIERWTEKNDPKDTFWCSISKDNITTWYGKNDQSRIADPADPTHVFSWLICESYDDKGNAIVYEYVPEDSANINPSWTNERNRTEDGRAANRYIKRIKYGNKTSRLVQPDLSQMDWLFEVIFDYDEGHYFETTTEATGCIYAMAVTDKTHDWSTRLDMFSNYRSGFEVRTYRLCRRVLMFHHFPDELGVDDYLVRSTEFEYAESHVASFITSVTQSGYKRQDDNSYIKKSLPPLEFEYSQAVINEEVLEIDAESLENLPVGLDGATYKWVDLDGEGVSGILTEQADAWFYKTNLGEGRFGPLKQVMKKPSLAALGNGRQLLMDLAGDGQLDLAEFGGPTPGFYERTHDEDWEPFKPFLSLPNIPWDEPNLRFVDLNGDGHADVLITEHEVFTWHQSLAEMGFAYGERIPQALDEEEGPRLVFADGTQSIYLSDLSGDGLADLVRIRNGEVCYWPNLGYGRFGARITMDNSPWFETSDQFDQQRIRLADIDGSGTTDIIYLSHRGVHIYLNQSGNSWSEEQLLSQFPSIDNLSSIMALDLLGNGTACLVWSSPLSGSVHKPMRYIDLMGGQKPHLLVKTVNNLGAETRVHYAPSTKFYLADKADGQPWVTKLPFPVHVVESVETYDRISRNRFVTRYAYHHGYFDGTEREFRGFGMVEQWDTEEYAALSSSSEFPAATNIDAASHVPPVHTKTWFHTGAYIRGARISLQFKDEYYREPGLMDVQLDALLLPDTILPPELTPLEEREACRSLKGAMLRQEVYALDDTPKAAFPYSVTEQNFTIRRLQPRDGNRYAVFFTHPREAINYHYERNPADPRIQHTLTLEVDDFGNVLKEAAIGYGRRQPDATLPQQADRDKQTQTLITYTENRVTTAIDDVAAYPHDYRTPLPCETRTYEMTGFKPENNATRFSFDEWTRNGFALPASATEIPYEQTANNVSKQTRLIEHIRTLYRRDDLTALLPLGEVEPLALPGESYKLAFTAGLLAQVFQRDGQVLLPNPAAVLGGQGADLGGYVVSQDLKAAGDFPNTDPDDHWWIPAGRVFLSLESTNTAVQEWAYAQSHFFQPYRYRDPFGQSVTVTYDAYDLLMVENRDALDNRVTVGERDAGGNSDPNKPGNDYRILQPWRLMDPNRNRTQVTFDALGMVVGTAMMGKPEESQGDSLDGFSTDLTEAVALDHLANPRTDPHAILDRATTRLVYDMLAFQRTKDQPNPQPVVVYILSRETHDAALAPGEHCEIQYRFSYSDGFGREIQKKIQAEPEKINGVASPPRWVGSGWTIFNNKGKPVRQYESFFSATHRFEFAVQVGVSQILFHDPINRVVATLHPNDTYEKVLFNPWQQTTWDVNDTVLGDPRTDPDIGGYVGEYFKTQPADWQTWHAQRIGNPAGDPERDAAEKAAGHADTPTMAHMDTLGRTFLTIADNGPDPAQPSQHLCFATRVELDIEGNQRAVIDAKDRLIMCYDYDMLGNGIHQFSMEAGARWILNDAASNPICAWDNRGHEFKTEYDELRRPVQCFVMGTSGESDPRTLDEDLLFERIDYGENQTDDVACNLRTRVFKQFDGAGAVTNKRYDFKGNLLEGTREIQGDGKTLLNWSSPPVAGEVFSTSTTYDALNRPVTVTSPDGSVYRPTFNEANLLDTIDVNLRGAAAATPFVTNIDYNAKGQRELIAYENGATTTYDYDPLTFRLAHLKTTRPANPDATASQLFQHSTGIQDLHYTYDPVGNITRIEDIALKTVVHDGQQVEPVDSYTYDALYRLIEAAGREHIGQAAFDFSPTDGNYRDYQFVGRRHANDLQALRNYTEKYEYDAVGNFDVMRHVASGGNWTRHYDYDEVSLIEADKQNNRLTSTSIGETTDIYSVAGDGYDAHGNMLRMPHLPLMQWDFQDQLQATAQQVVNNGGTPETTWYVYDSTGQRVRKVTECYAPAGQIPTRMKERIYLGGFEIYREYDNDETSSTLERETLHIMDGKRRIVLVETRTRGNDVSPAQLIRYQFGNHLGSASLELDNDGKVISYEEYYPYGCTSFQAVRNQTETPKRYRYTGKERDEESGLYYHGARYYVSWLGRWTSCDPEDLVDGPNQYCYGRNCPTVLVDPNGTDTLSSFMIDQMAQARWQNPDLFAQQLIKNETQVIALMNRWGYYSYSQSAEGALRAFDAAHLNWAMSFEGGNYNLYMYPPVLPDPNEQILAALPDGTGYIGTHRGYEGAYNQQIAQRNLQTLSNIAGGPLGAIGYLIGGERGSDLGAAADGVVLSFGAMAGHRSYNKSLSRSASPSTYNRPAIVRQANPATAPQGGSGRTLPTNLRHHGLTTVETRLLKHVRGKMFNLPAKPTKSKGAIVGVLISENLEAIPLRSGGDPGKWAGGPKRGSGRGYDRNTPTHIEGWAAQIMRERNIKRAMLLIEKAPCGSCDRPDRVPNITGMLERGSMLTVVDPGAAGTYRGR